MKLLSEIKKLSIAELVGIIMAVITVMIAFFGLLWAIISFFIGIMVEAHVPKVERFSSRIAYVPYLEYEDLSEFREINITESKATDGMRCLLGHTLDKNSRVEVAVIHLTIDDSVSNVSIKLNEYRHANYDEKLAYRPDEISKLVIDLEQSIKTPQQLNLKTFTSDRFLVIPLSVTKPVKYERDIDVQNHTYFNNLPRIGVSCHVDTENEVIGMIEYEYKNKKFKEYILEMKSVSRADKKQ